MMRNSVGTRAEASVTEHNPTCSPILSAHKLGADLRLLLEVCFDVIVNLEDSSWARMKHFHSADSSALRDADSPSELLHMLSSMTEHSYENV